MPFYMGSHLPKSSLHSSYPGIFATAVRLANSRRVDGCRQDWGSLRRGFPGPQMLILMTFVITTLSDVDDT